MNTSILKHNSRLKQRDSLESCRLMQVGELGDRNFGIPQCGPGTKLRGRSPTEAKAFCIFEHNILTPHGQKLEVSRHRGHQWIDATAGGSGGCSPAVSRVELHVQEVLGLTKPPRSWKLITAQVAWYEGFLEGDYKTFWGNIPPPPTDA